MRPARSSILVLLALSFTAPAACKSNSASTDGGAASDGGGTTSGDRGVEPDFGPGTSVIDQLSPEAQRYFQELAKLQAGEAADLDGDGTPEAKLTKNATGGRRLEVDWNGDGTPEYVSDKEPGKSGSLTVDANEDGQIDVKIQGTVGPLARTIERDTNFNGKMDRRWRETYDVGAGTVRLVIESDPEEDGTFTQLSDTTLPVSLAQGTKCDGQAGFPSNRGDPADSVGAMRIPTDGGGGRCTAAQAKRIAKALGCAVGKGLLCLTATNRELADQLTEQLADGSLVVGCGNTCSGSDANTEHYPSWSPFTPRMNLNDSHVSGMTDDELCSVVLHELLHWAGQGLDPNHDQGTDRLYACGRYCGGCTTRGPAGAFKSKNVDCAVCASTADKKKQCGTKEKLANMPCPPAYTLCHKSFTNAACEVCKGWRFEACDDTALPDPPQTFKCCETCPSGFTMNDKPCAGGATTQNDQCGGGTKPPFCP